MLRRDEKERIAAVDTGVPATAYDAVVIHEPSPFNGQSLTVYEQDPATLGHDQYLLTNPAGLPELNEALIATASTHQYRFSRFVHCGEILWAHESRQSGMDQRSGRDRHAVQ
jgi:hypothetical protein